MTSIGQHCGAPAVAHQPGAHRLAGAAAALGAVSIWAGWMSITRAGVTTSLPPLDLTVLRFGVAGALLLPVLVRRGVPLRKVGAVRLGILVAGAGAPYAFVAASGLRFAPAGHAGVLVPGVMPLFVALFSVLIFGTSFPRRRLAGYALIGAGLLGIVLPGLLSGDAGQGTGHALFLSAAAMWAAYTIVLQRSGLEPLHAAAVVAVGSAIVSIPLYLLMGSGSLASAPIRDVLLQGVFQGAIATVVSLWLFGRAVALAGGTTAASFGALVPALAALLSVPLLGEVPSSSDTVAIVVTCAGVALASGLRLPRVTVAHRATVPGRDTPAASSVAHSRDDVRRTA